MTDQNIQASPSSEWDIDNLPNRLTLFRLALIPIIMIPLSLIHSDFSWTHGKDVILGLTAGWTFVLAGITDFLDGYIARKRKLVTVFGSLLDPLADKFLVVSSLILLLQLNRLSAIIVIILVLREMYITGLRLLAIEREIRIPVSQLGKWKTVFQMTGIPMLMAYNYPFGIPFPELGKAFVYLAAGFGLYSAGQYTLNLWKRMKVKKRKARGKE